MATSNKNNNLKRKFKDNGNKNTSKRDSTPQSNSLPLQFDDDVPDFPRGGGGKLSREEREGIRSEVDAEFDYGRSNSKRKKKGLGVKSNEDDFGSLFGEGITGKLPRFANKITFKNIGPGMKLLGVIAEVNEKDLVVSLPGGLRGLVRLNEAIDHEVVDNVNEEVVEGHLLSSLFHVGQLVSCIVLHVDDDKKETGKRRVWLSLRLSLLHKGYNLDALQEGMVLIGNVKSIEDHGYILTFGLPSFTGFSPKICSQEVNIGQLLQGVVRSIDKARKVVHLSCELDIVSKSVTKDLRGISLDLLVPGMMVNARIQATLENGIMLSFLSYFSGTVDVFHLQNQLPASDWQKQYEKNKKVNARILFIDPSTRAVGLTMNPHLLVNKAPPLLVKVGEIYDQSKIIRVDKSLGLVLELPTLPVPTPAYVLVSDMNEEVSKLGKKFKEGSTIRTRILGFRHLEGLATCVLKASALEDEVFTHADVKPGMVLRAKVVSVKGPGAIVQFPGGVKALCPLRHMSELDIEKPRKKFKVGVELIFRVLGCKSKRITVTHKKTLVKSKLRILSSYAEATEGFITHGWISKIEDHGCFVRFYNGVQGFTPRSELGLEQGCEISSRYHVGQVVKCRVTSSVPASHRINLSLIISPTKVSGVDLVKLGSVVSGVVEVITPNAVLLHVNVEGNMKGTIFNEHLADHQGQAAKLKSVLKPGHELSQLLVLVIEGNNLILSSKSSLVNVASKLPVDATQIHQNTVMPSYICNLIESGCFVRFLGCLTGFSPIKKALDDRNTNILDAFYVGQSVRSSVLDISNETGRITLSLKQSMCSSTDVSFLQSYFLTEEKIADAQASNSGSCELSWVEKFPIGGVVEGKVHQTKDFGVVVSFETFADVFGFITQYQLGGKTLQTGSLIQAVVLDVDKSEHLVDLSLKPEFVKKSKKDVKTPVSKKKRKREAKELKTLEKVNARVEIVKEDYLVLSLPDNDYVVGYAALSDYNTQKLRRKQFSSGEIVAATTMALPSDKTAGRLLLLLELSETSSSKSAKKRSGYDVGTPVQAEITEIKPLELRVKFGIRFHGRVHITEANDENVANPFSTYKVGQTLAAVVVAKYTSSDNKRKANLWELSLKPSVLAGSNLTNELQTSKDFNFEVGQHVHGYVYKVDSEWVSIAISRHVRGQIFILDSACEPHELDLFQKRFMLGSSIDGYIVSMNKEKKSVRLVPHPFSALLDGKESEANSATSDQKGICHVHRGGFLGGRVWKILPGVGGLLVQIGPHVYGKVHYTELTDTWVPDPLSGYHEGQFVKCKVLEINHSFKGTVHIDLSLRTSFEDTSVEDSSNNRIEKIDDLQPNMIVNGYVKNVSPKGCFVMLSRCVDAKIMLSNLSDGYVEDPVTEFPIGKLVSGRIVTVEPLSKRVELTLKLANNGNAHNESSDLSSLSVGEVVKGTIRRVESFGLFIVIDNTNFTGLCHISEISDDHVDNINDKFRAGKRVSVKILKVDKERSRISLGMKASYFEDEDDNASTSSQSSAEEMEVDPHAVSQHRGHIPQNSLSDSDFEPEDVSAFIQAESRASVPPLEVTLDDVEDDDVNKHDETEKTADGADAFDEKSIRRAKKKAKEEKEQEIMAAEQRLLEKDAPRTTDEFEKVVRSSPNSSFVWLKYMQFMLSIADVEGARTIAERALKTINITCESEKLNVWVAYLNLENQYGNPPEDAVMRVFKRALQFCDPLKLHMELLGLYERTEQQKLADELLIKMCKKFKSSCEVWLRRIQWLLKEKPKGVDDDVKRALLCLPQHEHIKFLSQVAIFEFKNGVPDKGRALFEKMLREYPKRRDLWSVYLDQEIRLGDVELIRALFERATSLSLPAKKMKFVFKKYLNYEKSLGDEERIQHVIQKANEYVESAAV